MTTLAEWRRENGFFDKRRSEQAEYWFGQDIRHGLLSQLEREPLKSMISGLAQKVAKGEITPGHAAADVLAALQHG